MKYDMPVSGDLNVEVIFTINMMLFADLIASNFLR